MSYCGDANGVIGKHFILDFHEVANERLLYDIVEIEAVLRQAAIEGGATILSTKFHEFGEGCGITGVVVLSESHLSIHTWRETRFAAIDIFMCGDSDPEKSTKYLLQEFKPERQTTVSFFRGQRNKSVSNK